MVGSRAGVTPGDMIFDYFRGSTDGIDIHATTDTDNFKWVSAGVAQLHRINFVIIDTTMKYGQFYGIVNSLANGITIKAHDSDDSLLGDFFDSETWKDTEDINILSGVDGSVVAAGVDAYTVRWTIAKAFGGKPLVLNNRQYLSLGINDDVSSLDKFRAMVQGCYI